MAHNPISLIQSRSCQAASSVPVPGCRLFPGRGLGQGLGCEGTGRRGCLGPTGQDGGRGGVRGPVQELRQKGYPGRRTGHLLHDPRPLREARRTPGNRQREELRYRASPQQDLPKPHSSPHSPPPSAVTYPVLTVLGTPGWGPSASETITQLQGTMRHPVAGTV